MPHDRYTLGTRILFVDGFYPLPARTYVQGSYLTLAIIMRVWLPASITSIISSALFAFRRKRPT